MTARRTLLLAGAALAAGAGISLLVARSRPGSRRAARPPRSAGGPSRIGRGLDGNAVAGTTRLARGATLARLGSRVGRAAAANRVQQVFASPDRRAELTQTLHLHTANEVAAALGTMKGAMMKLGQMASYLDDGLPAPIREALSTLLQGAPAMSADLAAWVIETELGRPPSELFAVWEATPMAAASIGQVHRAVTTDGREVAVKVQYPGVDRAIRADLENTGLLFGAVGLLFPGLDPAPVADELRLRLTEELDYRLEAANQRLFADYFRDHPFIHVPDVVEELSTGRVLTTELATGARFDEVVGWSDDERNLAAETIFRFVFRSLYRLHAFNGDPHPGNYLFRPGGQVTFLDFGLVKRFDPDEVEIFERMIEAVVIEPDPESFRRIIERVGLLRPGAPVTTAQVLGYFGHFYEFVAQDRVSTITAAYASETVRRTFDTSSPVTTYASVPPAFVIIQRINLGLYAILGRLQATANWRRVAEELWPITSRAATTDLGRREAAWLAGSTPAGPGADASSDPSSGAEEL